MDKARTVVPDVVNDPQAKPMILCNVAAREEILFCTALAESLASLIERQPDTWQDYVENLSRELSKRLTGVCLLAWVPEGEEPGAAALAALSEVCHG